MNQSEEDIFSTVFLLSGSQKKQECYTAYETPGHIRNLTLIWPDGKKLFFPYSSFFPVKCAADQSQIDLSIGSQIIRLRGENLDLLFQGIAEQRIKEIIAEEERYHELSGNQVSRITTIEIIPNAPPNANNFIRRD